MLCALVFDVLWWEVVMERGGWADMLCQCC